jgi:hypothetical protein
VFLRNVSSYKSRTANIPEDAILHSHRRKNLKSYMKIVIWKKRLIFTFSKIDIIFHGNLCAGKMSALYYALPLVLYTCHPEIIDRGSYVISFIGWDVRTIDCKHFLKCGHDKQNGGYPTAL